MKKLKLAILLCLVFVLAITAVACGSESTTTKGTTEATVADTTPAGTTVTTSVATTTTPVTTEPTPPEKFTSLKIGETPLSEYTIVYARSKYYGYAKMPSTKAYFPVYDFDHETADRLSDLIFEVSGVRLKVVEDMANKETANEILVGDTNRTEAVKALSLDALESDDYLIDVEGTKLVICGGENGTTWHAIDYLEELFSEQLKAGNAEYAFATDYTYKGIHHMIRIGCIGDSITEGYRSTNASMYSYPAQLGRYLWKDALVTNYGSSGSTMRSDLSNAYTKRDVYTKALSAASNTDIFVVMLGTNDPTPGPDDNSDAVVQFNQSCINIVKELTSKNGNLQFLLANCPAYFGTDSVATKRIRDLQEALVGTLNTMGYPTTFFDMYSVTKDMGAYFPDKLHPNDRGYMMIGEAVAKGLDALINPTETE